MSRVGAALATAVVLIADCPWGDFQGHTHWAKVRWIPFVTPPVGAADIALNVLLFVPLGAFRGFDGRSPAAAVWRAGAVALPLALFAEWTQIYSHSRIPSMTDVTCNVAGALAGAAIAAQFRRSRGAH